MTLAYTCYVDDSGSDGASPAFVLAGWIARCDAWETFSNAWEISLDGLPKPLRRHQGKRYFRHTDAMNQKRCFDGFTDQEAAFKTVNLSRLVLPFQPHMLGYTVSVPMTHHKRLVQDPAVLIRGEMNRVHKNPFYLAFQQLAFDVYESYWNQGLRDPVDIIVDGDKPDKALEDMKKIFAEIKADSKAKGESHHKVMGDIFGRSAKDLAPLQLADMLAGQTRLKHIDWTQAGVIHFWRRHRIQIHNETIRVQRMREWATIMNATLATKRLSNVTRQAKTKTKR